MSSDIDPKVLVREWLHSHEEDTPGKMVFRPASFPFPPSRGRLGFELRADASLADHFPGPGDAPQSREGRWGLGAGGRALEFFEGNSKAPAKSWTIDSAGSDKLILRK